MKIIGPYGDDWPIEDIKLCVEPGWGDIIERLIQDLEKLGWNGQLNQVKEKFGGLRFYIGGGTDSMSERIDKAEEESLTTCEACGKPGKLRGNGWLYTACDGCVRDA